MAAGGGMVAPLVIFPALNAAAETQQHQPLTHNTQICTYGTSELN